MQQIVILLAIFAIINCFSLTAFAVDKIQSKKGAWRISEISLILIALFAPYGALAGMLLLRHKTRKPKFLLLVPAFLVIQTLLMVYFLDSQLAKDFLKFFT
jgi:uncharacterized membrane protein YsdA (DUF1294 family)